MEYISSLFPYILTMYRVNRRSEEQILNYSVWTNDTETIHLCCFLSCSIRSQFGGRDFMLSLVEWFASQQAVYSQQTKSELYHRLASNLLMTSVLLCTDWILVSLAGLIKLSIDWDNIMYEFNTQLNIIKIIKCESEKISKPAHLMRRSFYGLLSSICLAWNPIKTN